MSDKDEAAELRNDLRQLRDCLLRDSCAISAVAGTASLFCHYFPVPPWVSVSWIAGGMAMSFIAPRLVKRNPP
jgi:hypothetical protein